MIFAVALCLFGCGPVPSSEPTFNEEFQALAKVAATASGYATDTVHLLGSSVRLRVDLSDPLLATSDQSTREQVATTIVAALEAQLASHPHLVNLQVISIAIIHVNPVGESPTIKWHIEDVVEFRKGPDSHFIIHST